MKSAVFPPFSGTGIHVMSRMMGVSVGISAKGWGYRSDIAIGRVLRCPTRSCAIIARFLPVTGHVMFRP
ncbi:hypothetical protein [Komagataeibacter europaeus]|uniref:hypothetical protein n=1 Tax=Komagataeibacter europaeus TaxID=33995 RepID=UPI000237E9C5|nr:hypothetical protein [Komagataeibacter europaeus]